MRRGLARRVIRYGSELLLAGLLGLPALPGAEAGDVVGVVKLAGDVPPVMWSHPASDHTVCGSEPRRSEALIVSSSGGIKNAVVFLGHERMEGWQSPTVFQLDQRRCTFVPRVLIVPPGSTVEVLNSDGILHNFHTLSRLNPSRNLAQPKFARALRVTFEQPEVVQVKCDLHGEGFMRAWIVVASHPYYALTDEDGRFRLPDLSRGPHTLEVWHETLGTKRLPVTVGESGEVAVIVTFATAEGGSVK
jgi:plastocyanin